MKDTRITTVDLWLFVMVVFISISNLNSYVWIGTGQHLIFTGGKLLSFFMFIAGYFLVKYYKDHHDSSDTSGKSAWKYAISRYSKLYPALLGGVLLAFVVRNAISHTALNDIFNVFMDSIWEFIGLSQIGVVGLHEELTGVVSVSVGTSLLWNGPAWYISALIISSLILYYIICKNEDFFVGLFAPIFIIITFASVGLTEVGWDREMINFIGMPNGIARVMATMSIGMLMYYVVDYLKKLKFTETMKMTFSILHVVLAMFIIYTAYVGITWNELTHSIFLFLFAIVLLTNKDYVSCLYNKSKFCYFLGRLSLYFYVCHIAFVYLLAYLFPEMTYYSSIIFNLLFSGCWAFIMMYVDDYVITPIFRTKHSKAKSAKKVKI